MTDAAEPAQLPPQPSQQQKAKVNVATETKRPFWETPKNAGSAADGGGGNGGGGGGAANGQTGSGQQRGPVRLLRITVPPVEGRCKCGE